MKPVQLLALLLALACAPALGQAAPPPASPVQASAEEQAIMDRIERDVRMPQEAGPLAAYHRYYAWRRRADGARKVVAVYVGARGGNGERRWVAETALPVIDDGGCDVISLSYDVASQRIEQIGCNGYA
jgi:hypothetical protein